MKESEQRMKEKQIKHMGRLRAAVLGANDGIVSTASLVVGVAASNASHSSVLIAGIAGLVSGSMAMATGEYVSVSSQSDTEVAALDEERAELKQDATGERRELAAIYVRRGLDLDLALARRVADKLMDHDALGAHARDELGISEITTARPLQAAGASALSFATGAALPLAVVAFAPPASLAIAVGLAALVALACLGGLAARAGGARLLPGVIRVTFWSALAMAVTYGVGRAFRHGDGVEEDSARSPSRVYKSARGREGTYEMHLFQRLLIAYTLAFFAVLRGLSDWAGERFKPAGWFILAYGVALALPLLLLPPWLLFVFSMATAIPFLVAFYALIRRTPTPRR